MATFDEDFIHAQDLAVQVAPEYAKYIRWWIPYARPGIDQFHVAESRNFYYDPSLPPEVIAAELIHLSHHIKQRHGKRGDEKRHDVESKGEQFYGSLWRISTCLEVVEAWSERVEKAGLQWGPGTDLRDQIRPPRRMKAEEIYDWLDKNLSEEEKQELEKGGEGQSQDERQQGDGQQQDGQQGQGQQGQGQQGQGQQGQGQQGQGQQGQGQQGQGQQGQGQQGQGQQGQGQQGQGQGEGQPGDMQNGNGGMCRLEDYDLDEDAVEQGVNGQDGQGQDGKEGEGQDGEGKGDGQGQEGQGKDGQQGQDRGKQPGSQDADIQRESDPRRRREIMWMKIVKQLMSGNELEDYGMQPPSNRSPDPLLLPELQQQPETIGILIDVSSSVNQQQLQVFVELAATIHRRVTDIKVALGNTKVTKTGRVSLLGNIRGEGGTSFEKVIPEAYKKLGKPTRYLVITDGETQWPKHLPPNTTIVVLNDRDVVNSGSYKMTPGVRRRTLWVRFKDLAGPDLKQEIPGVAKRSAPEPSESYLDYW